MARTSGPSSAARLIGSRCGGRPALRSGIHRTRTGPCDLWIFHTDARHRTGRGGLEPAVPELFYDADIIVVSADQVACRLTFDCTPQRDFLGFSPNGTRLSFAEHVFYRFHDGRIASVSSLIDRYAIQRQLGRDTIS